MISDKNYRIFNSIPASTILILVYQFATVLNFFFFRKNFVFIGCYKLQSYESKLATKYDLNIKSNFIPDLINFEILFS